MAWLPDGEKILKISIRFDATHELDRHTDRQTAGQTPHDSIGRAYASHRTAKTMYQYCTEKIDQSRLQ